MPIPGQTALTTIDIAKEQALTFQPLLLAELTLVDGSVLRLSDENLVSTDGGPQFMGHDWLPRIKSQSLGQIQAVSDNGIVQSPTLELTLADPDKEILTQWEIPDGKGLKGAKLRVLFTLWDADTSTFATDGSGNPQYAVKFSGVCNPPSWDEATLTLSAINSLNLSRVMLPSTAIQRTCPYAAYFPQNFAERTLAASSIDAPQYLCGYSADIGDPNAVGNTSSANQTNPDGRVVTDSSGVFVYCGGTWDECLDRLGNRSLPASSTGPAPVQIEQDQRGRHTGRFGGIHFDPPLDWRGINYISGVKNEGLDNPNTVKFNGDYFPHIWGTTFVNPPVMNVVGNPNSTKLEVAICAGQIHNDNTTPGPIQAVVVNDYVVPWRAVSGDPTILGWSWVSLGSRNGSPNRDLGYDGAGDPYGTIACILIVIPIDVAASNTIPTVQVLTSGPMIRQWHSADPSDYTLIPSDNFALNIADLLTWCGFQATAQQNDFDLQTFLDAGGVSNADVTYTDLTGLTRTRTRYHIGLALRQRRPASDILKNVLAGAKAYLTPNLGFSSDANAGKLQLWHKQTLADAQPSRIPGSNYDTPVDSFTAGGAPSSGFVAYRFDRSNVARKEGKDPRKQPLMFKIEQRPIQDTPNELSVSFQDEDYSYNNDGLQIADTAEISRVGQEIAAGTSIEGIPNWDQAKRAIQAMYFEQYRGNPRTGFNGLNDSGGTWIAEWETSFRAIHLAIGQIVLLGSDLLYTPNDQTFRILSIKVSPNFERMTLRAMWHEDDPYTDAYGQSPSPILEQQLRNKLRRPPFGWNPNFTAPLITDPLYSLTEKTYGIGQAYEAAADGTAIAKLRWSGFLPVNAFATQTSPPYAPQAETTAGGGTILDGTYYLAISGIDANNLLTPPSNPIAQIATTGGASSITLPNIFWPEGSTGWNLYAGTNPNKLSKQASGTGTPGSVSMTSFNVSDESIPDVMFDHLVLRTKVVYHSGVFGAQVNNIPASNVIECDGFGFSTNEWAGRVVTIAGQPNTSADLPVWDFLVASSDATTLTLADVNGTAVDLNAIGVQVGDTVIMRTMPDIISDTTSGDSSTTIGDSKFVNEVAYHNPPFTILDASNTSPIVLELATPHDYFTGADVTVSGVGGNDAANGIQTVTIPTTGDPDYDSRHVILNSTTGDGDYTGGGSVELLSITGLEPDAEIGRFVRIVAGTGRFQRRKIIGNNTTTLTVDGGWGVRPDLTSVFIIEDPAWIDESTLSSISNSDPLKGIIAFTSIDNFLERMLWTQVFTSTADDLESVEFESPGREIYVYGGPGTAPVVYERSGFEIEDATVGDVVAPLMPARKSGTAVDFIVQIKTSPAADTVIDIQQINTDTDVATSIFPGTAGFTIPAGSTGRLITTIFSSDPLYIDQATDYFSINIVSGDGSGQFTTVLKWLIANAPDSSAASGSADFSSPANSGLIAAA